LIGALMLDVLVGEPPALVHPVVWMGKVLDVLEAHAPGGERSRLVFGLASATLVPLVWAGLAQLLERRIPWPLQAILLKSVFAGRALLAAASGVERGLVEFRLEEARLELRSLVSRPTQELDNILISSAAIESLAENFVDSWVAPLAAYCLFGMGGAYAYRAANTADAMWGYHTPGYEWLGKGSARADDLLNWLPARVGALLLGIAGSRPVAAYELWWSDSGVTDSPNAGQPMSVAAGHLGVRLEKPGCYVLNREGNAPSAADIAAARRLVARVMVLAACLSILLNRVVRR